MTGRVGCHGGLAPCDAFDLPARGGCIASTITASAVPCSRWSGSPAHVMQREDVEAADGAEHAARASGPGALIAMAGARARVRVRAGHAPRADAW
jgi:hypothetical protein